MASTLGGCAAISPRPVAMAERLAAFPTSGLPLEQAVTVRWNEFAVPYIEADSDRDLAFTLGLVHAHLRLGQLAVGKRVVQGRVSEMAGPFAQDLDQALRTLDLGYAAPAIEAAMPTATRAWMQAFVDGLNWYQDHAGQPPPEYGLLGLRNEPWRITDLLTLGRLAGIDINWITQLSLLGARDRADWDELRARVLEGAGEAARAEGGVLPALLGGASRSGSNAVAVAPGRSASGAALLASDPHLGLVLPNLWIVVGLRSPSFQAVGLMPPGLPILGLGRNPRLAWSGTNMAAAASDLYDVSREPPGSVASRTERLRTRLWFDKDVTVRRSRLGPVISDIPQLAPASRLPDEAIALRWTGQDPSDELTAFLSVMRAGDAPGFRTALAGYGVGGQNMVFATAPGRDGPGSVGKVAAVHLPRRQPGRALTLVQPANDPSTLWQGIQTAADLPWELNPRSGQVASANDKPAGFDAGPFYAPSERIARLQTLLESKPLLTADDLAAHQFDTLSTDALGLRDALVNRLDAEAVRPTALLARLRVWDGRYDAASPGPVAFKTLLYHVVTGLYAGPDGVVPGLRSNWSALVRWLPSDLDRLAPARRTSLLSQSLAAAEADSRPYPTWGDMHRLRVGWAGAAAPVVGRLFRIADYPSGGSRNTVMKSAHGLVRERHDASFGSMARQVVDMADLDSNRFTLFGGQDGWLGSANFADQVPLWRDGRLIRMPLRPSTVAREFPTVLHLRAGP